MKEQIKAIALSYARAAVAAVAALYMAGVTDPRTLANAFIAALKNIKPGCADRNRHPARDVQYWI